jgi:hypothetical protein
MTTTPDDPTTALPGRPPVVDLATWQAACEELLVREKAHTREGDAIAAARRRLPMAELDGTVQVVGPDGPVPFLDLLQGRKDAVYLNARGVSFAILTTGRWDEVASYVEFMGYTQPWYSCATWRRRSAAAWVRSPASCATATACSSPTPRRAVARNFRLTGGRPNGACWYWRSDADGNATWGPTSRPVPQWTRPGATPVETSAGTATTTDGPSSTAAPRC